MNRTEKFLINATFSALYQVIVLIAGFIIPRILLQFYGSEVNGLVSSITQFINYFNLVEAGLAGAAVYALYRPLAYEDIHGINRIVSATQKMYIKSGCIFCILLFCLTVIYPNYVFCAGLTKIQVGALVFILGVTAVLEFFTLGKYRAILTADQKLYVISISSICYQILSVIVIAIGSCLRIDIVAVRFVALFPVLIRSIILVVYCKKKYKYLNYKETPNYNAINKRWDAFILQILGAVHTGVPIILATIFTDLISVSIYTVYNLVLSGISGILGVFTNGLSSAFGEVIAKKETETLKKTYKEFMTIYYMLIVIVYGIAHRLILPFIELYTRNVSDAEYINGLLAMIFVLDGFFYNLKTPQGMLVISAGLYRETKIPTAIQGMIVVLFGCVLTPQYGLIGIVCASLISNIYRCLDLAYYIPKNVTKTHLFNTIGHMAMAVICMLLIVLFNEKNAISINSWSEWFMYAVIYGLIILLWIMFVNILVYKKEIFGVVIRIRRLRKS